MNDFEKCYEANPEVAAALEAGIRGQAHTFDKIKLPIIFVC